MELVVWENFLSGNRQMYFSEIEAHKVRGSSEIYPAQGRQLKVLFPPSKAEFDSLRLNPEVTLPHVDATRYLHAKLAAAPPSNHSDWRDRWVKGDPLLEALAGDGEVTRSVQEILRLHRRIAELESTLQLVEAEHYISEDAAASTSGDSPTPA